MGKVQEKARFRKGSRGSGVEGCFLHLEFDGNPYRSHFDYK